MKIYGYSHETTDELLELYEATISASPEELRELSIFFKNCADSMERKGSNWNHEHFVPSDYLDGDEHPELVVFNPNAESE